MLSLWCAVAQAERYTVPLLVPAGESGEPQGLLRIANATEESGAVEMYAIDDAGVRSGPVTFTLNAASVAEFTATDLESGNAVLGLTGGIGTEVGDARLEIQTDLQIVPLTFVRAADGTLSAMHDTVRGASADASGRYVYDVPVFNPSTEMTQISRLRLINPGDEAATVTIEGLDDTGSEASGGDVSLTLAAGGARTLTAQQLEAGEEGVTGQFGAGTGKWRLAVSSDRPLEVVNIVASAAGYWNNLSTTAAPGPAPANLGAFNARIAGKAVVSRTTDAVATLVTATGEQFSETVESDGVTATHTGDYGYAGIGPDAGRLTLAYDGGDVCASNLYFASRTSGWFASHCTGSDNPAEGTWLGGSWSVEDEEDDGGDGTVAETTYGVDEALPGVPTSGFFIPAVTGGGSRVSASAAGTTISLDNGGYFELNDGTRYTCAATGGCTVVNGVVTAGTVTGRAAGTGEVDRFPSFRTADSPGNQSYTVGTAIDTLTLPEASGGNGDLSYSLSPTVPGLTFNAGTRQLSGTPSTAGTYSMTYAVTDEDADTDALGFTITVSPETSVEGSLGVCDVGMTLMSGQSCTYPGTTDAFSVNARGRGSFLTFLAGIRIRINNETINGRTYDFEASHQGDGVWRINRVAGSTEAPTNGGTGTGSTDTSPSFAAGSGPGSQTYTVGTAIATLELPEASGGDGALTYGLAPSVPGLTFNSTTRQLTGTPTAEASYNMAYTVTDEDGDTDTLNFAITVQVSGSVAESFALQTDDGNSSPEGMVYANDRFYVLDSSDRKAYAYSASGQREPASDFDLHDSNADSEDITHADGRFYVLDWLDDKVYAYSASGQRDEASEFDLHEDNSRADAIAYHNGRFYVSDWLADKVFAYSESGERDEPADFELVGGNPHTESIVYAIGRLFVLDSNTNVYAFSESGERVATADFSLQGGYGDLVGMTHADGRFYVVDESDDKVYAYSASGRREPSADFELPVEEANTDPAGITYTGSRYYVLDDSDYKVYAYSASGERDASADFDLSDRNDTPRGIAYFDGRFYVVDSADDSIFAYSTSGERDASADFDLGADSRFPRDITYANGRFYVVDSTLEKVHAYSASGERDTAVDFDLHDENSGARGITFAKDRLFVVDTFDDKVYAYFIHNGQRDASADFDLHDDNGTAIAIDYAAGRFYVVDSTDDKVYSYPGAAEPDGPDLMAHAASVTSSELSPGESFTFSAIVSNRGNQASAATTLRYFRSTDRIISTSDTEIGTDAVGGLSAGATSNESISLTAPGENGCYFCGACVDTVDGESTTSNNCSNPVVIAVGDQVDLEVSRTVLHAPGLATLGVSTIRMTVDVTNNGPGTSAPAKLNFTGGRSVTVDIPAMAPGATVTFESQSVGTAQLGTTRYTACIDYACDANAQNNCGSRSETYLFASGSDGQIRRAD